MVAAFHRPEGERKLAGGASHRTGHPMKHRPGRGGRKARFPAPLPGRVRSYPGSGGSRHRLISVGPPGHKPVMRDSTGGVGRGGNFAAIALDQGPRTKDQGIPTAKFPICGERYGATPDLGVFASLDLGPWSFAPRAVAESAGPTLSAAPHSSPHCQLKRLAIASSWSRAKSSRRAVTITASRSRSSRSTAAMAAEKRPAGEV